MMTSNGCRSNLVATSATSSTSRITLVENDPKFIANNELTSCDTDKAIIDHPPRTLWVDRLLAMFCVKSASSKLPIISKEYIKPETLEESEVCWQVPVFLFFRWVHHNFLDRLSSRVNLTNVITSLVSCNLLCYDLG